MWTGTDKVSEAENALLLPYTKNDVEAAILSTHPDSGAGSDGLHVRFILKFGSAIKGVVMDIFQDFYVGVLDASRLNYGVVMLIPKVVGDTDIPIVRADHGY